MEEHRVKLYESNLKVVFACNRIGGGGAERVICNFSNRMVSDGNEVVIVCLDILPNFDYPLNNEIKIIQLDRWYKSRSNFFRRKLAGIKNLFKLFLTLRNEKPDIVVSFYTRQSCYAILACKLLSIPVVAAERDHFFAFDSKMNHIMRKIFYPRANGFIHQTKWAKQYLRTKYDIKVDDIILPNPVWIQKYPYRHIINKRVLSVGRLDEQKNYCGLVRAFRGVVDEIPNATLSIYGDGDQRKDIETLIESLDLKHSVTLHGRSNQILECYAKADIFVLFSHGEGYPNVLMEALAMGIPCIASNAPVGGAADMIKHGENGILVAVDDEHQLTVEMIRLLNDETMKKTFSQRALSIRYSNDFNKIYCDLMQYVYRVLRPHKK